MTEKFVQGCLVEDFWKAYLNVIKGRILYQSVILRLLNLFRTKCALSTTRNWQWFSFGLTSLGVSKVEPNRFLNRLKVAGLTKPFKP